MFLFKTWNTIQALIEDLKKEFKPSFQTLKTCRRSNSRLEVH